MIDFISDRPILASILVIVLILALIFGGVYLYRNARNLVFKGNEQIFDTNWRYAWAIVELGNGELLEGEVTSWKDFNESDMIQFTMNGITYLTHSSKVILCTKEP